MFRRILTLSMTMLLALGMFAVPLQAKPASSGLDADVLRELAQVRRATAKYQDVTVALDEGYALASPCVAHPELGGMGYHYMNESLMGQLDPRKPQMLVYAPGPGDQLRLVAVEYAYPVDLLGEGETVEVLGRTLTVEGPPTLVTLHAWVWQANPAGMFTGFNPNISC